MADKFLKLEQLSYYNDKLKETYVTKELKSGSRDEYKVLSDNNLTDELLAKIQNAGSGTFTGDYNDLTSKPAIDGVELTESSTAETLGLAKADQLPKTATEDVEGLVKPDGTTITIAEGIISAVQQDLTAYAKVEAIPTIATVDKAGIVKPDGKTIKITAEGVISAEPSDLSLYALKEELPKPATQEAAGIVKPGIGLTVTEDGTLNAATVDLSDYVQTSAISDMETQTHANSTFATKEEAATKSELADYAKSEKVAEDIEAAKQEVQAAIDTEIGSVYKVKGSVLFAVLPLPAQENIGDVYNIEDSFTTDVKFFDEGKTYPAGTNVVVAEKAGEYKYDALAGAIDLSTYATTASLQEYMKTEDLGSITNQDIDSLFSE